MTILEEIFISAKKSDIDNTNKKFFSDYLNKEVVSSLIDVRDILLKIINIPKEEDINSNIKKLNIKLQALNQENYSLLKEKIKLMNKLVQDNSVNYIDMDDELNKKLKKVLSRKEEIKNKIDNNKKILKALKTGHLESSLKNKLKDKLKETENLNTSTIFYDKKDNYKKSLRSIVKNEKARMCYSNYIFEMIGNDIDNLKQFNSLACGYIEKNKIDKIDRLSILLSYSVNKEQTKLLDNFSKMINNKKITNIGLNEISDEYFKNKTLIDTMLHFSKNFKNLATDNDVLISEYNMIKEMSLDIEGEKNNLKDSFKVSSLDDILNIFKVFNNLINKSDVKFSTIKE